MTQPWRGRGQPATISESDFERAAERIGCDVAAIKAVWEVEAGGRHFLSDRSVIRRFEPHHFPREHWSKIGFTPRQGEAPWRASLRLSNEAMFLRAADVDQDAAMVASSWGAPQIMGFNHKDAGFASARQMVEHMAVSASNQLDAFVQLVESWGIAGAIRAHDWLAFARRYNGSGQVERYAQLMETAYRKHSGDRSAVVLRVGDRGAAVEELQRALGIEVDGAFGPVTLSAVKEFQANNGLAVDGVVGRKTWAALSMRDGTRTPPTQPDPKGERTSAAQSTTIQASVAQIAGGAGTAITGASMLDGTAQILLMVLGTVIILAAMWIFRERIKHWKAGVK